MQRWEYMQSHLTEKTILERQVEMRKECIVKSVRLCEIEFTNAEEVKLLKEMMLRWAITYDKAAGYLDALEEQGRIIRENGKAWSRTGWKGHLIYIDYSKK